MEGAKFWDNAARKYSNSPVRDVAAWETTLSMIRPRLTPTSRVLEVGCGTGSTVMRLAPICGSIHGTDYSPEMIAICREKASAAASGRTEFATRTDDKSGRPADAAAPTEASAKDKADNAKRAAATFEVADVCSPSGHPAADRGTYDLVMGFNFFYLLDDPAAAAANINGLLRPGGLFLTKNMALDQTPWYFRAFVPVVVSALALIGKAPKGIRFSTGAQTQDLLRRKGFEIEEAVVPPGDAWRKFIVAKKVAEV